MRTTFFPLYIPIVLILAACSSGSGGGSGSSSGSTPDAPKSEKIADLAAFAAEGSARTNSRGITTSNNSYRTTAGVNRNVKLAGTEAVGLLTVIDNGDSLNAKRSLIGTGGNASLRTTGYYGSDAEGSLRMSSSDAAVAVRGTSTIAMSAGSGDWSFGADLWESQDDGVYIGGEGGTVVGNTMTFDPGNSTVTRIQNGRALSTTERAGARAVFSADGNQVFGRVTGSNASSGFNLDAGFAGKHETHD